MPLPPVPFLPALLLAAAARLGWIAVARDPSGVEIGTFTDGTERRHLVIVHGGEDGTWTIVDALPRGFGAYLLSRQTYEVLSRGSMASDGSIAFDGQHYRVRAWFTGTHWTAEAVTLETLAA